MKYYEKKDTMFYQFDEDSLTYTEIYKSNNMNRIMKITGNQIFNDTLQRILNNNFEVSSSEVFQENYNIVKNSI